MTTNFIKSILVLFFVSTILVSCKHTTNEELQPTKKSATTKVMTILGKKLPNVQAPENVKLAWENLINSNPGLTKGVTMDFNPTYQYVKFTPKDDNELEVLQKMYGIDLDDTPAFYEYIQEGQYYHDPLVINGTPTYQYAILKVGRKLPANIKYEVLEQLLLFDNSEKSIESSRLSEELISSLEYESWRIKGLADFAYGTGNSQSKLLKLWRPYGEVNYIKEDGFRYPVEGATIKLIGPGRIPIARYAMMTSNSGGLFSLDKSLNVKVYYRVDYNSDDIPRVFSSWRNTEYKILYTHSTGRFSEF